ncbi:MAG TPA: hypothetical protein VMD78_16545 [Candidatus Baltobacteraceae bacterium]|nr:hypothetical protein [Candidatus Baltobacteraceae bacterium]
MAKMVTIEQKAVGFLDWDEKEQARIERNVFLRNGQLWEGLRFCKNRNGRHNRVHLVIKEADFVDLFQSAVENGVFEKETLERLRGILEQRRDPFLDVIGSTADGKLAADVDDELYGESPA